MTGSRRSARPFSRHNWPRPAIVTGSSFRILERRKQAGGGNYFDELLAQIRDIHSSEEVFWRKAPDIYALGIDYDPDTEMSRQFFYVVQNTAQAAQ